MTLYERNTAEGRLQKLVHRRSASESFFLSGKDPTLDLYDRILLMHHSDRQERESLQAIDHSQCRTLVEDVHECTLVLLVRPTSND